MSEPTKEELLDFMKKHGPESVDSITDKDSAIKHFRTSSKLYKHQRDRYKTERDTLIDDIAVLRANISRLEQIRDIKDSALKGAEIKIKTLERENNNLKQSVSEYKDYAESHVANYLELKSLEHENKRLTRLTHKLTIHRTMWDSLKDWRRDMLEINKNDTQLIGLGLVMDELEKRHLYKGDE